ncbi:MAG: Asp-tRNA(Asn)/Glu-tRNA(Gln) amidotransferase subunit GatC [Candidatus Woesearchaeota archaeon]
MKVDKNMLEHVAELARLRLTDKEIETFIPQFKEILNAFAELDSINVDNVNPSFHPVKIKNVMREDKEEKCLSQDEALSNTKNKKEGYFKGPRAI